MTTEIFKKAYSGDDLNDLERDVSEALDTDYNELADVITSDEHGFINGTIVVTMTWVPDSE